MPFTASHVAAVLPLARRPLVPSALVAGSLAPDLPYFALLRPVGGDYTHTWWGLVVVDVPIALAALALYRAVLLRPLLALAPAAVRSRVAHLPAPRLGPAAAASALVGVVTHFAWDAFTHHDGWGVRLFPALEDDVLGMPGFALAQWLSTVLGALVTLAWCARQLSRMPRRPVPARYAPPARPALVRTALAVFTAGFAAFTTTGDNSTDVLVSGSITVVTGALAGVALYGAWRALRGERATADR
ncbi:DUF4184 family protein [Actinosynnema sp. NPDC050436]|uniref:DUF4184 family protein n=1 Tax=Actinosynnema sp. NPDC050436 TaxID=3155659 RepID=UPI0033E19C5D